MKAVLAFLALCVLLLISPSPAKANDDAGEEEPEYNADGFEVRSNVLVLTEDNFDDALEKYPTLMVEFYAPWCGHCKQLEPEYSAAAGVLSSNEHSAVLAKVDATVHAKLGERFEVQGYPTIHIFKNGKRTDYEGPRKADGIVKYMKEVADPAWEPEPDAVLSLTDDTFKEVTDREELMLVEFYAPWCGHCKRLAPVYEKAAKQLKTFNPPILLAKVDATVEKKTAEEFEVKGYPTMFIFKNGKHREYTGGRDSEHDIIDYLLNQRGDGVEKLDNLKGLKAFLKEDRFVETIATVGFFSSKTDPLRQAYMDAADALRDDYTFGIIYGDEARKHFNVKPGSVVVFNPERFYTKFEKKWYQMEMKEDVDSNSVKEFIRKHTNPLVGEYSGFTATTKRYDKIRPLCMVFYQVDFGFDYRQATQKWRTKIAEIAKDYPEITFVIADEEAHSTKMNEFGLGETGEDMNIGLYSTDRRYAMEAMDDFDSDHIREFLDGYKKGTLKPFIKSAIAPKKQTGPVKIVVGSTFDKIVMDESKDVLIEMYAPWCGHCKQLEPLYKQLAQKLKHEKNLVIAKMDATVNEPAANFDAEGFPTIYFAPASKSGKKSPMKYNGDRTVEKFTSFLKTYSKASFKSGKDEL